MTSQDRARSDSYTLPVEAGNRDSGIRLAELVAAFSLAIDLGLGQPMEHVLRSWLIAARLGDHVGIDAAERAALYYVATLAWIGCVADTPEVAAVFGDDIAYRGDSYQLDMAGVARAAAHTNLPDSDVTAVRRAGLLHDIGLHGIPATMLDKPGPLTASEAERFRLHAYYAERMLARPPALARLGVIASMTHERCDGSGYHRGVAGTAIPLTARLLAAACAYRAMIEPRSYRDALSPKSAAAELRADVRAGRLDQAAVDAVLPQSSGTGGSGIVLVRELLSA